MAGSEGKTITFPSSTALSPAIRDTIAVVYTALRERGYDPVGQLAGYLITGDPTYITAHNRARTEVLRVDRLEIVEEMVRVYLEHTKAAG